MIIDFNSGKSLGSGILSFPNWPIVLALRNIITGNEDNCKRYQVQIIYKKLEIKVISMKKEKPVEFSLLKLHLVMKSN